MFDFAKRWFAAPARPIGVDFGTDALRLAQVARVGSDYQLIAAASVEVPARLRDDAAGRAAFFVSAIRDLLAAGHFRGRDAVLALPAASVHVCHVRLARLDDADTRRALPWELKGKLPVDPAAAVLRHVVAGEVSRPQEDVRQEVIVMAAARDIVRHMLADAAKARLNVVGLEVEPTAVIGCFGHVYRRKSDAEQTTAFVDIGCGSTRVMVARGNRLYFARTVPIGGDHFNAAVASALGVDADQAKALRVKWCVADEAHRAARPEASIERETPRRVPETNAPASGESSFTLLDAVLPRDRRVDAPPDESPADGVVSRPIDDAARPVTTRLIAELDSCRRYHDSVFPQKPIDRLIFIGGEARQRGLCQSIARGLGLVAQLGDPMVRLSRTTDVGVESGLDRRQPQPAWAVALGLSMGPAPAADAAPTAARAA